MKDRKEGIYCLPASGKELLNGSTATILYKENSVSAYITATGKACQRCPRTMKRNATGLQKGICDLIKGMARLAPPLVISTPHR